MLGHLILVISGNQSVIYNGGTEGRSEFDGDLFHHSGPAGGYVHVVRRSLLIWIGGL